MRKKENWLYQEYNIGTVDELIERLVRVVNEYYEKPQWVFDVTKDCKYIIFSATELDWLAEQTNEAEFFEYLRSKSKYNIDTIGPYYKLDLTKIALCK
jgi:hypothetical protein